MAHFKQDKDGSRLHLELHVAPSVGVALGARPVRLPCRLPLRSSAEADGVGRYFDPEVYATLGLKYLGQFA